VHETTITVESGGTRIMLVDYGPMQEAFPPPPDHFELDDNDRRFLSCLGFEGWNVIFTEEGQAVQAFVRLGSETRRSDVTDLLDRLVVD
jgi:hypothetical protein